MSGQQFLDPSNNRQHGGHALADQYRPAQPDVLPLSAPLIGILTEFTVHLDTSATRADPSPASGSSVSRDYGIL
ncbi:hypothetical protein OG394_13010 [Kribbella sp. NBC_01245]|uniref:hypothetical protein n=1 Tax=Kribbella sp. NBC_01245 TaxID=2903578 RepID=UPI002E290A6A|nr:hypothetical protein [Kribbella sp. NBC_01245]